MATSDQFGVFLIRTSRFFGNSEGDVLILVLQSCWIKRILLLDAFWLTSCHFNDNSIYGTISRKVYPSMGRTSTLKTVSLKTYGDSLHKDQKPGFFVDGQLIAGPEIFIFSDSTCSNLLEKKVVTPEQQSHKWALFRLDNPLPTGTYSFSLSETVQGRNCKSIVSSHDISTAPVVQIYSSRSALAGLKSDGTVVAWGVIPRVETPV